MRAMGRTVLIGLQGDTGNEGGQDIRQRMSDLVQSQEKAIGNQTRIAGRLFSWGEVENGL